MKPVNGSINVACISISFDEFADNEIRAYPALFENCLGSVELAVGDEVVHDGGIGVRVVLEVGGLETCPLEKAQSQINIFLGFNHLQHHSSVELWSELVKAMAVLALLWVSLDCLKKGRD